MDRKTNVIIEVLPDNSSIMNIEPDQTIANLNEPLYRKLYILSNVISVLSISNVRYDIEQPIRW